MMRSPFKKVKINLLTEAAKHSPEYAWDLYGLWLRLMGIWATFLVAICLFQAVVFVGAELGWFPTPDWALTLGATGSAVSLFVGLMFIRNQVRFWRSIWQLSLHIEEISRAQLALMFHVTEEDSQ